MAIEASIIKSKMDSLSVELKRIDQSELQSLKDRLTQIENIYSFMPDYNPEPWGFFRIFRRSADELTHSYILAYLFDPNRPHGLGYYFLEKFIDLLKNKGVQAIDYDSNSVMVNTEVPLGEIRIDIIVDIGSSALVFENKVFSPESEEQTIKIEEAVKNSVEFQEKNIVYIFLTPKGFHAENRNFLTVSFIDIKRIIKDIPFSFSSKLPSRTNFLLSEFLSHIKEEFEMSKEEWSLSPKSLLYLEYHQVIEELVKIFQDETTEIKQIAGDIAIEALPIDANNDWEYYVSRSHYQQIYKKNWIKQGEYHIFFETWINSDTLANRKFMFIFGSHNNNIRNIFYEDKSIGGKIKSIGSTFKSRHYPFAMAYKEYHLNKDLSDLKNAIKKSFEEHAFLVEKADEVVNELN